MPLLHIYDRDDRVIGLTVRSRGDTTLPVSDIAGLISGLNGLLAKSARFDRILFETHGSPGRIYLDGYGISASTWRGMIPLNYCRLTLPGTRIYFNGCDVAAGIEGWRFLEAVAAVFLRSGGGEVFAQTSVGWGVPFSGHVVHLWGDTRTLFVDSSGRIREHFEQ